MRQESFDQSQVSKKGIRQLENARDIGQLLENDSASQDADLMGRVANAQPVPFTFSGRGGTTLAGDDFVWDAKEVFPAARDFRGDSEGKICFRGPDKIGIFLLSI